MSELDDLLGGGPAIDEMDDLLGGSATAPVASSTTAFDDDLLFGASSSPATAAVPSSAPAEKPKEKEAAPPRKKVSEPKIPPITETTPALQPFLAGNVTYFARFVVQIDREQKRLRRVLTVTDTHLRLLQEDCSIDRVIPLTSLIGIVCQNILVSRRLGMNKDWETHVLVQVSSERDVFFSLCRDDQNPTTQSVDVVNALCAMCMTYNFALPVSHLREDESIESMVKWMNTEDKLRKQYSEVLAYRTELTHELNMQKKLLANLELNITGLKNSTAGQAVRDIKEEIHQVEEAIEDFKQKQATLEASKLETAKLHAQLVAELAREDGKRAAAVRETLESSSQEELMRQVAEYELMKNAHKREVDKISAITSVCDRRLASRSSQAYNGVSQLTTRISVLEEEEEFLLEKVAQRSEAHVMKVRAVAEAKRRLEEAKRSLTLVVEEINIIKVTSASDELPSTVTRESAPVFEPVVAEAVTITMAPPQPSVGALSNAPTTHQPPSPPPSAAAKAPINLDDDDDI
jgi:hypothetical protein